MRVSAVCSVRAHELPMFEMPPRWEEREEEGSAAGSTREEREPRKDTEDAGGSGEGEGEREAGRTKPEGDLAAPHRRRLPLPPPL